MKKAEILRAIKAGTVLVWNQDIRNSASYRRRFHRVLVKVVAEITEHQDITNTSDVALTSLYAHAGRRIARRGGWVIQTIEPRTAAEHGFYRPMQHWTIGRVGDVEGRREVTKALVPSRELEGYSTDFHEEVEAEWAKAQRQDKVDSEWAQERAIKFLPMSPVQFDVYDNGSVQLRIGGAASPWGSDRAEMVEAQAQLVLRALPSDTVVEMAKYSLPRDGMESHLLAELLIDAPEGEVFGRPRTVLRAIAYGDVGMTRSSFIVRDPVAIRTALRGAEAAIAAIGPTA